MKDFEVLEILKDELTKCFIRGDGKLPLAVGIHEYVLKHFENDKRFDAETLKNSIRFYALGTKYLNGVIFDKPRIDITGNPVSKVTKAEQRYAKKILNIRKKAQSQKLLIANEAKTEID